MGKTFPLDWTDHIFNPWTGRASVSPGSAHGGAEPIQRTSRTAWGRPLQWNAEAASDRRRRRVLCGAPGDVFDPGADPQWREELWALIRQTPLLDWVIPTRYPEAVAARLPAGWGNGWPNVCLLVSAEDQEGTARVPLLLDVPARYRGLLLEPLLGPVKLQRKWLKGLDWIVVGGESGKEARPAHPDWVRSVRSQCESEKVRFYFKGWGNWVPDAKFAKTDGGNAAFFPHGSDRPVFLEPMERDAWLREWSAADGRTFVFRTGKPGAARKLDGRTHARHPFPRTVPEKGLPLSAGERHRLQMCEKTIREGMGTFVAVGTALMEIRDARLYRQTHPSFEAYVQSVLALTRPRAYQLIDSAEVMRDLSTILDIPALPQNEGQARELGRWKTARERAEKWKAVLDTAAGRPVTARFIRQTLCPVRPRPLIPVAAGEALSCLERLRRLLRQSPAEARAARLIARLEEVVAEGEIERPEKPAELFLPGFDF